MQMPLFCYKLILAVANLMIFNISITFNILFFLVSGIVNFKNASKEIASLSWFNKGTDENPELNTFGMIVSILTLVITAIVAGTMMPILEIPKYCKQVFDLNSEEQDGKHHSILATILMNLCNTNKLTKPWATSIIKDPNSELALVEI